MEKKVAAIPADLVGILSDKDDEILKFIGTTADVEEYELRLTHSSEILRVPYEDLTEEELDALEGISPEELAERLERRKREKEKEEGEMEVEVEEEEEKKELAERIDKYLEVLRSETSLEFEKFSKEEIIEKLRCKCNELKMRRAKMKARKSELEDLICKPKICREDEIKVKKADKLKMLSREGEEGEGEEEEEEEEGVLGSVKKVKKLKKKVKKIKKPIPSVSMEKRDIDHVDVKLPKKDLFVKKRRAKTPKKGKFEIEDEFSYGEEMKEVPKKGAKSVIVKQRSSTAEHKRPVKTGILKKTDFKVPPEGKKDHVTQPGVVLITKDDMLSYETVDATSMNIDEIFMKKKAKEQIRDSLQLARKPKISISEETFSSLEAESSSEVTNLQGLDKKNKKGHRKIHPTMFKMYLNEFNAIEEFAFVFVDDLLDEALSKVNVKIIEPLKKDAMEYVEMAGEGRLDISDYIPRTPSFYSRVYGNDLTPQEGRDMITDIINNWNMKKIWKHCINFLGEKADSCCDFFIYEVKWSEPTNPYPVPQATASVFFTIEKSRVKPSLFPPKVSFVFETERYTFTPLDKIHHEMFLENIIDCKTEFFRQIRF